MIKKLQYLLVISFFYSCVAAAQSYSGFLKSATNDSLFHTYKDALEVAKKGNDERLLISKYLDLGDFYFYSGIYTEAVDQYSLALALTKPDTISVKVLNRLGDVYLSLKNYAKAQLYLKKAAKLSSELKYIRGEAQTSEILGGCYEKMGDYPKALIEQQNSLRLFTSLNDNIGVTQVNENIGSIYEDLNQFDKAHMYFQRAYELAKHTDNDLLINILNNLGDVFRKTGNYQKGLAYTLRAKELAERINDGHQLESAHKDLAKTYILLKDYKNAYEHLKQAEEIREELFYSLNFNQMNVLQTIYETKQKEAQIKLLMQESEVNTARQNLLWLGLLTLVSISIIIYVFLFKKRKASQKIQEYKERTMKAEIEKKTIEEQNLQNEIQLKTVTLSKYSLNLAQKNKLISEVAATLRNMSSRSKIDVQSKLKEMAKELEVSLEQDEEWDEFMQFFEDIHPDFIKNISAATDHKLSSTELRLAMLLRLNLSSKEIASVLRVTPDSVRVARHRLRKKLPINQKQELVNFMLDF
ncbi:tetratricopeptide repeat protein [Neptunitalea chrysea]|uniref:tetratricopeptide repeat protein n=1 Tax=Neptunitalea chrysea TaxID=1647581 RepID=UPI00248F659A|nr:tetratricopeptide repeat protein [Neptunitalea chrysea]